MIKKLALGLMALALPFFFFLEVWSVYSYNKLADDIQSLEKTQDEWLEANNKVITGIELFSSPSRIEKIAREQLHLEKIEPSQIMKIRFRKGDR
ncbi:MAG: cell division protein FtsL [Spirochaetales bacterium]|nr:cell division protein FtsL [Spirochaetales bacterium]